MRIPFGCVLFVATCWACSFSRDLFAHRHGPFPAPTVVHDSVRGRVHVRNGLFHNVYRERWGNGIQPAGAMVLTNLFNNLALVGSGYLTGNPVSDGSGKPSDDGDFSSESAAVSDATHQQRMTTLSKMDNRADDILKALKVSVTTDSGDESDVRSDTTFQPETARPTQK